MQENYDQLRANKLFSAAIPQELGGGGIRYTALADMIGSMAKACGSTALAYAMHSHPVLLNVYKFRNAGDSKAKAALTKIAAGELVIAGTGANDWLQSSGSAVPTAGGYHINAHKRFVSGSPGAQILVTSAVEETSGGEQVLHFSIPFSTPGIRVLDNWDTLGMRGTGSQDVLLQEVFVPEEAVVARRPAGRWHPVWDTIIPIAMPLIVSCYLGLAEQAVELALLACKGKPDTARDIGTLKNRLRTAQLARNAMVDACADLHFKPGLQLTDSVLSCKSIATGAILDVVNDAASLAGGPGFFREHPLERISRDARALHFHPLPEAKQVQISGRLALGLEPV